MADAPIRNNELASQFELTKDGETAMLSYQLQPGSITFVHTGVPEALEGQGIAKQLAMAGLEFAREKGLTVVPLCPFVAGYIKRHPEYMDLVREDHRGNLIL